MKALLTCVLGGLVLAAAVSALEPVRYPAVRMPRLQQMPLLVAAQTQQERHDKYKDDKDAYCFNPDTSGSQAGARQRDAHAHACACHLTCQVGPNGEVVGDSEDNTCQLYCTRERCACHVESPCEMPH